MSKLAVNDRFMDLSDYGRSPAIWIASKLKHTSVTPIHVTCLFGVCGLAAVYSILVEKYLLSAIFLILKSILDAADGELSRIKNTPSHSGRYLDSIFDIILNFMFVMAMYIMVEIHFAWAILAFISIQIQGTLYNYYYVILRTRSIGGDTTSKIFEHRSPTALAGETQRSVDILFQIFYILYALFDKFVCLLDPNAFKVKTFPNWFMTLVSAYGLGFQLLIMAIMLPLGLIDHVLPFFVFYNLFLVVFIVIRRYLITV